MIAPLSIGIGIAMGYIHGLMMQNALFSKTSIFASTIMRQTGFVIALFVLHRALNLDFISWGFGFFPALWYHALTKLREKPDEIRDI